MYKWIAFTQRQIERLLDIVDRHCQNSEEIRPMDSEIYRKIKHVKEREE